MKSQFPCTKEHFPCRLRTLPGGSLGETLPTALGVPPLWEGSLLPSQPSSVSVHLWVPSSRRPVVADLGEAGSLTGTWPRGCLQSPLLVPACPIIVFIGPSVYTQPGLLCWLRSHASSDRLAAALFPPGKTVFTVKRMKSGATHPGLLQWVQIMVPPSGMTLANHCSPLFPQMSF